MAIYLSDYNNEMQQLTFMKESKRLVQKGESTTSLMSVPLEVIGTPRQMRTGLGLSIPNSHGIKCIADQSIFIFV